MTLCALSDVKTMLDIASTDTSRDAKLNLMIKSISARIVTYLGYPVARATYTEEVHAVNNRQLIYLKGCPIQSVATVTIDGVAVTDFEILPEYSQFGGLYRGPGWVGNYYVRGMTYDPVAGFWNIKVTYTAGWYLPGDTGYSEGAADSLPFDISNAAMESVIEWYRLNALGAEGLKSHTEGDISDTFRSPGEFASSEKTSAGLSTAAMQMVAPYVRLGVA